MKKTTFKTLVFYTEKSKLLNAFKNAMQLTSDQRSVLFEDSYQTLGLPPTTYSSLDQVPAIIQATIIYDILCYYNSKTPLEGEYITLQHRNEILKALN